MATYTLIGKKYSDKLVEEKERKYKEIKKDFNYELHHGSYYSETIGREVNARLQDIESIRNLIEVMELQDKTSTQFRVYNNTFVNISLDELKQLKSELMEYGLGVHEKKWDLENKVANATSIETVKSITW